MLYFVPTPIGNLEDITLRAVKLLESADVIVCEDGRVTSKLMSLLEIKHKPKYVDFTRHHEINWSGIEKVFDDLKENPDLIVLVVSDAGSPGLSDPGTELVRKAIELSLPYTVLPGSNAVVPAVVASGFASKEFTFLGFLPIKKGRNKVWQEIVNSRYPVVIYESVHRMEKLIQESQQNLSSERLICVCKDISKMYEKIWVGPVSKIVEADLNLKGEFVVVIEGEK